MLLLAAIFYRLPAEWLAIVAAGPLQTIDTPDNLIAAMAGWIALETAALAFCVRAYIAQRDRYDTMLEKTLTVIQENRTAVADAAEAIETLAGKLERYPGARNGRTKKTP